MSINKLKLNKEKTEFLFIHSKFRLQHCLPSICFGQDTVQPSQTARNIGVTFDSTMSMLPHINTVCKSAFYHLRNLSRIRNLYQRKLPKHSCMPLSLPNLTTATPFCTIFQNMLFKTTVCTKRRRALNNILLEIQPYYSQLERSTLVTN